MFTRKKLKLGMFKQLKKVVTIEYIFCNWFLWAVHDGVLDPKFIFFTEEVCFHLNDCINSQNNRCHNSINS
jgi:hypothetical protein